MRTRLLSVAGVLLLIVVFIGLVLTVTFGFKFNDTGHVVPFGVYDKSIGITHAAWYNPLAETLGVLECSALVVLPFLLLTIRRLFRPWHDLAVSPWFFGIAGVLFSLFIWPLRFGYDTRPFDPFKESELPTLFQMQIPIVLSILVGVLLVKYRQKAKP